MLVHDGNRVDAVLHHTQAYVILQYFLEGFQMDCQNGTCSHSALEASL